MIKKELSLLFEEIALMLELKGENQFKTRAYTNAARTLELLEGNIEDYVVDGSIQAVKGIGKAISEKIIEYINTGRLAYYDELKNSIPEGLFDMLKIPGVGPKKVKVFYERLGIKSLGELEYACIENRLLKLEGFGEKTQANILKGIESLKRFKGQFLYGDVIREAVDVKSAILQSGYAVRCEIAGSLRRKKEVVKDIDIVASTPESTRLMDFFIKLPQVEDVTVYGDTKTSVRLKSGIAMDLRVVEDSQFPYVLNHFTGSKEHNTAIRHRAKSRGIKVNEYGLFKGEELIQCQNEEDIYKVLGLAYIPPEIRENTGEIEAAEMKKLPRLIEMEDILGTFHVHTSYSDGSNTIEEMVYEASKMGIRYIGISDHSRSAFYARGMSQEEILQQLEEIDRLNKSQSSVYILKGIESDILPDGSLDYEEELLERFDFVIASVHSNFKMERDKMTQRLVKALSNKHTTMLGHPTGRILLARDEYELDMEAICDAAAKYRKVIEINADPHRMDMDWRLLRHARDLGVKFAINTDAHNIAGLQNLFFGVGIARKGWLRKEDVVNTMQKDEIIEYLRGIKNEGY